MLNIQLLNIETNVIHALAKNQLVYHWCAQHILQNHPDLASIGIYWTYQYLEDHKGIFFLQCLPQFVRDKIW